MYKIHPGRVGLPIQRPLLVTIKAAQQRPALVCVQRVKKRRDVGHAGGGVGDQLDQCHRECLPPHTFPDKLPITRVCANRGYGQLCEMCPYLGTGTASWRESAPTPAGREGPLWGECRYAEMLGLASSVPTNDDGAHAGGGARPRATGGSRRRAPRRAGVPATPR